MKFWKRKQKEEDEGMTFWAHLEELRNRVIRIVVVVFLLTAVAFSNIRFIFDTIILGPTRANFFTNRAFCYIGKLLSLPELCFNQKPIKLISVNMTAQFTTHLNISIISGCIIAMPYIFWEFWKFLSPALKEGEKSYLSRAVLISSILFFIGVLFSYYLMIPLTVDFFGNYQVSASVENSINITSFIGTLTSFTLACGLLFEFPVIVYFLTKIGLLNPDLLKKGRRYSIVIVLTISAFITPPDVFSQIIVSIPLYILYEISILVSKRVAVKKIIEL